MKKIEINTYTLGDLATNCYLVWNDQDRRATLIDPADDGTFLSEEILRLDLQLEQVILTHGHFDHVLGLLEVGLNFPEAKVYLNHQDHFLIKNAKQSAQHWLNRAVDPVPLPPHNLTDRQELLVAGAPFTVIQTPGHTPGSVALYSAQEKLLFSGDTLFKQAIGRTDFKYSDPEKIQKSLAKLLALPDQTTVLPGHGASTTIVTEKHFKNL